MNDARHPISPLKPAIWNREPVAHVRCILAVASGKGGVGKSTMTVCLAHALQSAGLRTGILDADIQGPSIPTMLHANDAGQPEVKDGQLLPIVSYGIAHMSMGHIAGNQAAVWRGPMVTKAIGQMLRSVRWGSDDEPLDVLLVDVPPGTGDIHLSLVQQAPLDGAIIVTTPQPIATLDVHKCLQMFEKIHIPIWGIIENMSYFLAPDGTKHLLFGEGGGHGIARQSEAPLLAQIPLNPVLRAAMDQGDHPFSAAPAFAAHFEAAIQAIQSRLAIKLK